MYSVYSVHSINSLIQSNFNQSLSGNSTKVLYGLAQHEQPTEFSINAIWRTNCAASSFCRKSSIYESNNILDFPAFLMSKRTLPVATFFRLRGAEDSLKSKKVPSLMIDDGVPFPDHFRGKI